MKLVIAEKPSVAKTYADILGAKSKKDGYYEGNGYVVSWCVGHLLGLADPAAYDEKYAKWNKKDLPISPTEWKYKPTASTKKQLTTLISLIKRSDIKTIVNGADAGREGELIFRLVYEHAKSKKPIQRLWISSMEESAVKEGFNNLKDGSEYNALYDAAKCRQQADWLVGMNYSRLFSIVYNTNLRVGRVQTPTLAMVVERQEKVDKFIKEPFYVVELTGAGFVATTEKYKSPDGKKTADSISAKCNGATATIQSIKKQEKSIAPPKLYDLTTLQREANKMFGYTASKTLELVQSLYEKKLATYPRTDSKFITEDMAHSVPNLTNDAIAIAGTLLGTNISVPQINTKAIVNNSKVTDHHAILPTETAGKIDLLKLSVEEQNIIKMISVKFLCSIAEKHTYAETAVTVECQGEIFTAKGKTILNNGFKSIEEAFNSSVTKTKKVDKEDKALPADIHENQQFSAQTSVREGFTAPPKAYTEDTLLSAMENAGSEGVEEEIERKGLGTPATRAGIIENLVKNELLKRDKKNLLPTEKGINLIKILPQEVKSPLLTADWENNLKRMERGEVSVDSFMGNINESVATIIANYSTVATENKNLFGTSNPRATGEVIGMCPRCKKDVKETPKAYSCECGFALFKDNKFFTSQKSKFTKDIAKNLLKDGSVFVDNFVSAKTGKKYSATVRLKDEGSGYPNFELDFSKK
ncbi:MAG: DNA topoisomerase 3 [Defluviitaleaceae bacterium]|nr:DNA topoisomerase 3 [Defluviitaleaceae bacterium]